MRTASIDIGTNTVRLLICEHTRDGSLNKLYINRVITRLGEGFTNNKRQITNTSMNRTAAALKKFSQVVSNYNATKIRAVATSVVRESENGKEFVDLIQKEAGITVEVISGKEEAELTVKGVLNSIAVNCNECIIFDIGGGSTEYIQIYENNIVNQTSINMGVVHLTEKYLSDTIETSEELTELSLIIENILDKELKEFEVHSNNCTLIATAGTPTTLAAMDLELKEYNPDRVNNHVLTKAWITKTIKELATIPIKERANIVGLEEGREDIIVTGALITLKTMDRFSADEFVVSDGGVLEGIAHSIT